MPRHRGPEPWKPTSEALTGGDDLIDSKAEWVRRLSADPPPPLVTFDEERWEQSQGDPVGRVSARARLSARGQYLRHLRRRLRPQRESED